VELACSGGKGSIRANGKKARHFHGKAPVEINFNLKNENAQVFCRAGLMEEHEDMKKLHGRNGVKTNIKEFEAAFNIQEKDEDSRAAILAANEELIASINADRSGSWTAGVTSMSDKTLEEIQQLYTGLPPLPSQEDRDIASERAERELLAPLRRQRQALPASVDLTTMGRVSPAKNQAGCGSCAAFAAGSTIESCFHKVTGTLPTDISEQHLMDCAWPAADQGSNVCRAAWPKRYHEWMYATNNGGIANEGDYPYAYGRGSSSVAGTTQCDPSVRNTNHGAVVTSHQQTWSATEDDIMRLLAAGHSVTTSFKVKGGFGQYRVGVYNEPTCTNHRDPGNHEAINHAVAIVGYGEEGGVKYWKFKNSWGTGWGQNGFGKIRRGGGHCGFAMEMSVPFCSASSQPVTTARPATTAAPSPTGTSGNSCKNQKLTTSIGVAPVAFSSPNYPGEYGNDASCDWTITVPTGYKVNLMFDAFNTERGYDKVTVYDGEGTGSAPLKILQGKKKPQPVKSSGNKMTVVFTSDRSVTRKGFKASASATDQ
jgi:C1A family cysteine protease